MNRSFPTGKHLGSSGSDKHPMAQRMGMTKGRLTMWKRTEMGKGRGMGVVAVG